jgi:SAM-dependent methyltransferase
MSADLFCHICGGRQFRHARILWDDLVAQWRLSEEEVKYIDAQQGTHCTACGSNLRSIALAAALMRTRGFAGLLADFVRDPAQQALRVLELNDAGTLHPLLAQLPGNRLGSFPEVDMTRLPFEDGSYDIVIHSDTLEHVANPIQGLKECRRVLAPGGAAVFTVPTVIGRLTRSRKGLPPSYHGAADSADPGMLVHTEFGADVWTFVLGTGFASCELVPFVFPAGLAVIARR